MTKHIMDKLDNNEFKYLPYEISKVNRLWMPILLVSIISMIIGYFVMLPDDYENLSESVVASSLFANNILAEMTTKNYWDVVNSYKPLMHTWYVGVLMQITVVLPLIYVFSYKLTHKSLKKTAITTGVFVLGSVVLWLIPDISKDTKFYYPQFRFFEVGLGGMVEFYRRIIGDCKVKSKYIDIMYYMCCGLLVLLLLPYGNFISSNVRLLTVVVFTGIAVYLSTVVVYRKCIVSDLLVMVGKASFSVYLCHQVILAFWRYFISDLSKVADYIVVAVIITAISVLYYVLVEKKVVSWSHKRPYLLFASAIVIGIATMIPSGVVYLRSGVVRDVPELGIEKDNIHRNMHSEYGDIPYSWNNDFSEDNRTKVLVIGNSFARDWANVLNESVYADSIEISMVPDSSEEGISECISRVDKADIVFFSTMASVGGDVPNYVKELIPGDKLYIVGYKNYGTSNGIIYNHVRDDSYYNQSYQLPQEAIDYNDSMQDEYGDHYINMIAAVQNDDGSVRVFTDDNHFISQDCRHLTRYGAIYYSKIIDLSRYFGTI